MRHAAHGFWQRSLLVALAALSLSWPAMVNGGAFFATDSIAYIREPDQAIVKLLGPGHATIWSAKRLGIGFRGGAPDAAAAEGRSPPMAGRSIYYGLLANLGARTGGFWLTIALQALAAAFALQLLCRAIGWERGRSYLILAALAAFATPLGFFVCCVMPDVWAPIAILVAAALAAGGERLSKAELAASFGLLAFAGAAHTTHLLLLLTGLGVCAILAGSRRLKWLKPGAPGLAAVILLLALLVGAASGIAFNFAVKKVYGAPPVQPPFLTARLVGGGRPGDAWLHSHCPAAGFQACAYVSRLPMPTDVFLWSGDPARSAFWTASPAERVALGAEQFRFAEAVVRDDPLGVARQFLADGASQFADMRMDEFNHKDSVRIGMEDWMAGPDAVVWRASMAYRKAWPAPLLNDIEVAAFVLGLAGLAALAVQGLREVGRAPDEARARVLAAGSMVVVMAVANAVVCGGLSDIFGRYQARVTAPVILIGAIALAGVVARARQPAAAHRRAAPDFSRSRA